MGFFQELEINSLKKARKTNAMYMAPALAEKAGFQSGQPVVFQVGTALVQVVIYHLKGVSEDCLYLSGMLYRRFPLTAGVRLRFYLDGVKKLIRIGPVVGLLSTYQSGGGAGIYREWVAEGYKKGFLTFVFPAQSLLSNSRGLVGLTLVNFRGRSYWVKKRFPFPDVVYNQIRSRRVEALPVVKAFRRRFLHRGETYYFNRSFLNKVQVAEALAGYEEIRPHLPETRRFKNYRDCLEMLERYSSIFLKPIHGSLGCGIIKFTRPQLACYHYQAFLGPRKIRGKAVAAESLASVVKRLTSGQSYLIQQGISLLTIGGRPFDIRVLLQKNRLGCWVETHMFAKVASGVILPLMWRPAGR
ncbi:MAG: YheC/YheD family protein [Clostridia bacterium]|nr:YheC/YheD family protein [Clostridia bacterium]